MKQRGYVLALLMVCSLGSGAMAQFNLDAASNGQYQPRIGDIMTAV